MKSVRFYGIRDTRVEDVDVPKILEKDDVIIKVKVAGICGSDISKYSKTGPHMVGEILGHEFSGEVAQVGKEVRSFKIGDRVAVCPAMPCFECDECKKGLYSRCNNVAIIGNKELGGCFAEYTKVKERNLIKIPDEISYETAAALEPVCIAGHGLFRSEAKVGDTVVVLGTGPIGLFSIQWAKIFGSTKIIAVDVFDEKLDLAKELGADICINAKEKNIVEEIKMLTDGDGADIVIESAGTPMTCGQVLLLAKKGGTVLYAGVPYGDVALTREQFEKIVRSELTVKGTWFGNSFPFPGKEWSAGLYHMQKGDMNVEKLVTHRINLEEVPAYFEKVYKRDIFFGKIMINIDN
ncbi:galactitol-1-phosphate 5-dehydrogenase [Clostridioides difficile]|nr:galactitol-1-phosphate 5-dehydrogenase [Clostridioides difficile]